jgi:hypothetical protein
MRRTLAVLIATALLGLGAASRAAADDVAVIVNKANPVAGLTMAQLRKIVLGQETKWADGKKITVLMTTPGQPERNSTLRIVAGMSETISPSFHARLVQGRPDPPRRSRPARKRQSIAGNASAIDSSRQLTRMVQSKSSRSTGAPRDSLPTSSF